MIQGLVNSTHITGLLKRNLKTLDFSDYEIKLDKYIDIMWAIGSSKDLAIQHSGAGYS